MKLQQLKKICNKVFDLDIANPSRKLEFVKARVVYFYICRRYYPSLTLATIGESVNKDHATVINLLNKYDMYVLDFPELLEHQNMIISLIGVYSKNELDMINEIKSLKETIIDLQIELSNYRKKSNSTLGKRIDNLIETSQNREIIIERLEAFLKMNK